MTTLAAFQILKEKGLVDNMLVVASRRIIHGVWPKEIIKWNLPFTNSIIHGRTEAHRLRALDVPADVYCVNYENLQWLLNLKGIWTSSLRTMLVIDESSKMRNHMSNRFKSLRWKLPRFDRRVILTGTPAPKGLLNLYAQMFIVDEGEAFGTIGQYRNSYFHPAGYGAYDWVINEGAEPKIYKLVGKRVLRTSDKVLKLPPLKFVNVEVELGEEARALYDEVKEEFLAEWRGKIITAKNAGVATSKLRQVANGNVYVHQDIFDGLGGAKERKKEWVSVHEDKVDALIELIEELNGKPALISYDFVADIKHIEKVFLKSKHMQSGLLKDAKGRKYLPYIGGGVSDAQADMLCEMWNAGELPYLFGHPDSIAHGLNLQGPEAAVIFFGVPWDLENYEQFFKRVWRKGQKFCVFVYHLVVINSVDERVMSVLERKARTQNKLLDALEAMKEKQ